MCAHTHPSVDSTKPEGRELYRLMKVPIDFYEDSLTILKLEHFPHVFELFDYSGRKQLSLYLTQSIVDKVANVPTADEVCNQLWNSSPEGVIIIRGCT